MFAQRGVFGVARQIGRRGLGTKSSGYSYVQGAAYVAFVGCGYGAGVSAGLLPPPPSSFFGESAAEAEVLRAFVEPCAPVTERVFFDVAVGDAPPARIVLGLYGGVCPRTVMNFHELCASRSPFLSYTGCSFHRVIPGFMAQSGDFTRGDGTGGNSIYGGTFKDESFATSKHSGAGVLSMANRGADTNTSQFFLTLKACPHLDGKHVVFGCVLEGFETLRAIEAVGSRSGRPSVAVRIAQCGCLARTEEETINYGRAKYGTTGLVVRAAKGPDEPLPVETAVSS